MKRVLFVCLGNICRSPMAEALFAHLVALEGLQQQITCDSAGTANYHVDDDPDRRTLSVLRKNGIETQHVGRQFTSADFQNFDYILAMDQFNLADMCRIATSSADAQKIQLMRAFDTKQPNADVPDPYYGSMSDFEQVYEILERSCKNLLEKVKKEL